MSYGNVKVNEKSPF